MATVTVTSDVAALFSHDVYFELTLEDSASASHSVRLLDLGKLKYEFDIPNEGTDATAIGIKSGTMDIKIENAKIGGGDFIDDLESAFGYASRPDEWEGKMYFRDKGGSYGNPIKFVFNWNDIKYDHITEEIEISLRPYKRDLGIMNDYWSTYSADIYTYDYGGTLNEAQIAGEFIRYVLYRTYINGSWPPASSDEPEVFGTIYSTGQPTTGTDWFVVGEIANESTVIRELGMLAAVEGAVYGAALGIPFYKTRGNTNASLKVTLDTDNIEFLDKEEFYEAEYRYLNVSMTPFYIATRESNNPQAEKIINVVFPQSSGDGGMDLYNCSITDDAVSLTAGNTDVVDEGADNYELAFSFNDALKVKLIYWGISGIYPFSVINFDSNAPSLYQGKDFTVKNIEYNWKQDKVEMEIYQI